MRWIPFITLLLGGTLRCTTLSVILLLSLLCIGSAWIGLWLLWRVGRGSTIAIAAGLGLLGLGLWGALISGFWLLIRALFGV